MDMAWFVLLLSSFVILVIVAGVCDAFAGKSPGVERHGL
jgi:hypothetical protein